MKRCSNCGETKSLDCFSRMAKSKDGRQSRCKPCATSLRMNVYRGDRAREMEVKAEYRKRRLEELREWMLDYFSTHPCVGCGETDPVVLDFDHRDRADKVSDVCTLISRLCSNAVLEAEVQKCDVMCSNCHRRRTTKQMGWWRARLITGA